VIKRLFRIVLRRGEAALRLAAGTNDLVPAARLRHEVTHRNAASDQADVLAPHSVGECHGIWIGAHFDVLAGKLESGDTNWRAINHDVLVLCQEDRAGVEMAAPSRDGKASRTERA
jgi:hypothetical protein